MADQIDPEADSDLRRRAAWLLGMLAVVAVLFVIVLTVVIHAGGGNKHGDTAGPLDNAATSTSKNPTSRNTSPDTTNSSSGTNSGSSGTSTTSQAGQPTPGQSSCPTEQTCILDGDIGNGLAAINAYRSAHGKSSVTGSVSTQAQSCAVNNGSGCHGGWAETELAKPDGQAAVQKILPFAKLLDPKLQSVEVGWAFDPHAKLYYFAIVRND